jgi:signal transduction histidine kinase
MARAGWILLLLLLFATGSTGATEIRRVLIINSYGTDYEPFSYFAANFRSELSQRSSALVDVYEVSLASARFEKSGLEQPFAAYVSSLFSEHRLDLVVAIGAPAVGFVQGHRNELFTGTPMLLTGVEERRVNQLALTADDTVVAFKLDRSQVFAAMLKVLPQTKHIAVVTGSSPNNKSWRDTIALELQPHAKQVDVIWLDGLSFGEILKRATSLPPETAVYFGPVAVSSTELPLGAGSALAALRARANAPLFGAFDSYFGQGIVGGPLISLTDLGREAAIAANRILSGEKAANVKSPVLEFGALVFDWRELARWNIAESNLPPASIVQFREPVVWQKYGWYLALVAAFSVIEGACIVALLVNGRRLRRANAERARAEKEASELSGRLMHGQEEERARLARELHDDVTQRLASLAIEAGRAERSSRETTGAGMRRMREGLVQLSEDVHALSYRLHPSILEDLGLSEAVRSECERFSQTCPTQLETTLRDIPEDLPRNEALCVFRIVQEGLRNIARHADATRAEVNLQSMDNGLELTIRDDGVGFDPANCRGKGSLGHASMRQRINLVRGSIDIKSSSGRGTTIRAWVPVKELENESATHSAG